ncbi:hypothetical protein ACFU44_11155 [Nocardia rhizosphaerihabitans]|uniref:hypothetical protein n=1 Tax=Nocardia rhizosphaerihabitans TaxID=1691570 RepID=UPI00366C604C
MDDTRTIPVARIPLAYLVRAVGVLVRALVAESGFAVDELAQIIGARADKLRAGIADPRKLDAAHLMLLGRMADIDWFDFDRQLNEGARIIAAMVRDGAACHLCGLAFDTDSPPLPDGFGEHGQIFRCSDGLGCTVAEQLDSESQTTGTSPVVERCIYCGRDLTAVGANPLVVGHDDETGYVDRACGDGFGCNDAPTVKADR